MNRMDNNFESAGEARLKYFSGDYQILATGAYVVCAVTKQKIALEALRYWSEEHQEAYVDAHAALQRLGTRMQD